MKSGKLNFGHALGRSEMKKIMAGSGGGCYRCCYGITTNCTECVYSSYEPACPDGWNRYSCCSGNCCIA